MTTTTTALSSSLSFAKRQQPGRRLLHLVDGRCDMVVLIARGIGYHEGMSCPIRHRVPGLLRPPPSPPASTSRSPCQHGTLSERAQSYLSQNERATIITRIQPVDAEVGGESHAHHHYYRQKYRSVICSGYCMSCCTAKSYFAHTVQCWNHRTVITCIVTYIV
jgi:hypothetical protein